MSAAPCTNFNNFGTPNGTPHPAPTQLKPSGVPFLTFCTFSENILSLLDVGFSWPTCSKMEQLRILLKNL
ncbi:MAG: hypothetical protein A2W94_09095 [Bacteroidetes bacterium GWE2_42_42]|nr:MAG: hypothetical protein A2W94_09095 [Bacteroidetes bacterium GWE2_42_42]